jgi:hypothetical protein
MLWSLGGGRGKCPGASFCVLTLSHSAWYAEELQVTVSETVSSLSSSSSSCMARRSEALPIESLSLVRASSLSASSSSLTSSRLNVSFSYLRRSSAGARVNGSTAKPPSSPLRASAKPKAKHTRTPHLNKYTSRILSFLKNCNKMEDTKIWFFRFF